MESDLLPTGERGNANGAGVIFSLQALAGFTIGGLLAIVATLAAGLQGDGWVADAGRVGGFAACGALGGAALGVGLRPGAWKSGALGFGLGFIAPALLTGPMFSGLLALQVPDYGTRTLVLTTLASAAGYGLAGGLGAAFLDGGFALAIGMRFLVAGGLGGLIAACGPALSGSPSAFSTPGVIGGLAVVVTGHMVACCLGGWLAGLAVENELKVRSKPKVRPRTRGNATRAGSPAA